MSLPVGHLVAVYPAIAGHQRRRGLRLLCELLLAVLAALYSSGNAL